MSTRWTPELEEQLLELHTRYENIHTKWLMIAAEMGLSPETVRSHWKANKNKFNPSGAKTQKADETGTSSKVEYGDNTIYVVQASPRVMSQEELMAAYKIDPEKWRVEKYIIRTSEGYRKDRQVSWHVENGVVVEGNVEDSGKMLVVPLYHMELRLVRREEEIKARDAIDELLIDACAFAPKYPRREYARHDDPMLYEIAMPDIHFGRLTWHEESGEDFDIKIAEHVVRTAIQKLLQYSQSFGVERILLPIGNDFFNVNSKTNTTVRGTPQQEDTRWQKTFRAGRVLATEMIDACAAIAPTDVLIIPGNHDEEKIFYLGDALTCWYHNNDNVSIDNCAASRKYYAYGKVLLGFTHGDAETAKKLPNLMQFEQPKMWGESLYREWHTGDKHHKMDYVLEVDEQVGMVVRILRSLVAADAWSFGKGFVGSQRAAEAFLWHPDNGLIAQFTAGVDMSEYHE
jgi:hypothetical protein